MGGLKRGEKMGANIEERARERARLERGEWLISEPFPAFSLKSTLQTHTIFTEYNFGFLCLSQIR